MQFNTLKDYIEYLNLKKHKNRMSNIEDNDYFEPPKYIIMPAKGERLYYYLEKEFKKNLIAIDKLFCKVSDACEDNN